MSIAWLTALLVSTSAPPDGAAAAERPAIERLAAGDHVRSLMVDGRERTYRLHLPEGCDAEKPTPVVLVYHGALTNGLIWEFFKRHPMP